MEEDIKKKANAKKAEQKKKKQLKDKEKKKEEEIKKQEEEEKKKFLQLTDREKVSQLFLCEITKFKVTIYRELWQPRKE